MGLTTDSAFASMPLVAREGESDVIARHNAHTQSHAKDALQQCLAQVVHQISLFTDKLRQTKQNGVQASVPFVNATPAQKPFKRRGRPPGSKNRVNGVPGPPPPIQSTSGPLTKPFLPSPVYAGATQPAIYEPPKQDNAACFPPTLPPTKLDDSDGTGNPRTAPAPVLTSAPVALDVQKAICGDSISVSSDDVSDKTEASARFTRSLAERKRALLERYEYQEPSPEAIFLTCTVLEFLDRGITQEKELRNSVVELMRESGVRVSAKGSVVGSPLDVSLVCSVLKGIGLCFDTDTTDAATSSDTSSYITDSRTPESSSSVSPDATAVQDGILQHLKRKWEGVIETYTQKRIIATRTQSPETERKLQASANDGLRSESPPALQLKDVPTVPLSATSGSTKTTSKLGTASHVQPLDEAKSLAPVLHWLTQMKHTSDLLHSHIPALSLLQDSLPTTLSEGSHWKSGEPALLHLLGLSLPIEIPPLAHSSKSVEMHTQMLLSSVSPTMQGSGSMQPLSPARNALFELSPAIPHKQTTLGTAPEIEDSTSTHASDSLRHRKAHPSQTRSWAVSKDAEGAFIQAEGCLERWAQAVFDEAQTYENEEYILRQLCKRCGVGLPPSCYRYGTRYLCETHTQARALLFQDGTPMTASLLWERARGGLCLKRARSYTTHTAPAALNSVHTATPDYPSHRVSPLELNDRDYVGAGSDNTAPCVWASGDITRRDVICVDPKTHWLLMPDLTIKTQAVEWSDVAKEFTPLRAENTTALNEHSTPTSEGGPETFTFIHTLAAHGEGSHLVREELFAVDAQGPALKRQRSEVVAPAFRVLTAADDTTRPAIDDSGTAPPVEDCTPITDRKSRRIAGGFRVANLEEEQAEERNTYSSDEEDVSDEAIALRHERVLQAMRERFARRKAQSQALLQAQNLMVGSSSRTGKTGTQTSTRAGAVPGEGMRQPSSPSSSNSKRRRGKAPRSRHSSRSHSHTRCPSRARSRHSHRALAVCQPVIEPEVEATPSTIIEEPSAPLHDETCTSNGPFIQEPNVPMSEELRLSTTHIPSPTLCPF